MKNIKTYVCLLGLMLLVGCKKDNLEGPNASFSGELRDRKTGELIPQEISDGSRVYYIEQGWDNPPVQNTVIKSDGTFKNTMMFSGNYRIILDKGNYVPLDTVDMELKPGENFKLFEVNPYLRIIEPEIVKNQNLVTATFRLEQVTANSVYRISLFAHSHIDVSNKLNVVNRTIDLNRDVNENEVLQLTINLDEYSSVLKSGNTYYFRIGAQSQGNETKYNYAASVKIDL